MIALVTKWFGGMNLEARVLGFTAVAVSLAALAFILFHPRTVVEAVPVKREAAVTSQAVNIATAETKTEASTDAKLVIAKEKVHGAKGASDPEGDAGTAGINALCGLHEYTTDPACSLQRSNP